ncbi:MAG TPA: hypothetical protein VK072_05100, partial [Candidatus Avamphibacillus sp.]|nr:hypothetical protein [Candidatus Avamphibacillus sp.]
PSATSVISSIARCNAFISVKVIPPGMISIVYEKKKRMMNNRLQPPILVIKIEKAGTYPSFLL